jgi:hypothetical protein
VPTLATWHKLLSDSLLMGELVSDLHYYHAYRKVTQLNDPRPQRRVMISRTAEEAGGSSDR